MNLRDRGDLVAAGGALLVLAGLWVAWPPAALILGGLLAIAIGIGIGSKDRWG